MCLRQVAKEEAVVEEDEDVKEDEAKLVKDVKKKGIGPFPCISFPFSATTLFHIHSHSCSPAHPFSNLSPLLLTPLSHHHPPFHPLLIYLHFLSNSYSAFILSLTSMSGILCSHSLSFHLPSPTNSQRLPHHFSPHTHTHHSFPLPFPSSFPLLPSPSPTSLSILFASSTYSQFS